MDPDGIRNGSNMKDLMTSTNNRTGKNEREYSMVVLKTLFMAFFPSGSRFRK
jgi:hypothetical protein